MAARRRRGAAPEEPPARSPGQQPRDRVLRLRIAGPAVVVWTLVVALCYALTEERNWQRATWLSDRWESRDGTAVYGIRHLEDFVGESVLSASNGQEWVLGYAWLLTGVAVLAVLRTWRASTLAPLDDRADRLLFLAFFPLAVSIGDVHLDSALADVLWIPLYMLTLYAAVTPSGAMPSWSSLSKSPGDPSPRAWDPVPVRIC